MSEAMTVELPFGLPGLNDILRAAGTVYNSSTKKRTTAYSVMKKKFNRLIKEELLIQGCIPAIPHKRIWVAATWIENKRSRDPDNVRAGIKFVLDAMVDARVIEDDELVNISSITDTFEQSEKRGVRVAWGEA